MLITSEIQEDASKCYTFIKGYGDFDGQQTFAEAGLQIEFTHPLAQLIGKEAPPLVDGRIKKEDSLKKAMELLIKKKCHCFYFLRLCSVT